MMDDGWWMIHQILARPAEQREPQLWTNQEGDRRWKEMRARLRDCPQVLRSSAPYALSVSSGLRSRVGYGLSAVWPQCGMASVLVLYLGIILWESRVFHSYLSLSLVINLTNLVRFVSSAMPALSRLLIKPYRHLAISPSSPILSHP
jgi:hypothetical protein